MRPASLLLRSTWNGHPPERVSAAPDGLVLTPHPDFELAVSSLVRFDVRFGEDSDDDGFVDVWRDGAAGVAHRDAVELTAVLASPRGRAPASSVTLTSGEVVGVRRGEVAAVAIARVPLGGVTR